MTLLFASEQRETDWGKKIRETSPSGEEFKKVDRTADRKRPRRRPHLL